MRLLRIPEPFDHPDFLYEVKFDAFRALAHINGHHCQLVSKQFRRLTSESQSLGCFERYPHTRRRANT